MGAGAGVAGSADRLGDGRANGAGSVRAGVARADHLGPNGGGVEVALSEAVQPGRMELVDGKVGAQKWQQSDSIYVRMMRAQADVRTLTQDADIKLKNKEGQTAGSYKGITAAQIVTAAKSVLIEHGIIYLPIQSKADVKITGNKTALWVDGQFICCDNPESMIEIGAWGAGTDNGDKDYAKAFTNANKQILAKALGMSTVEDDRDDPVAHEPEHKPREVKNAQAMSDMAIKTWADAYKAALDGCRTLKDLKRLRSENSHMMNNPHVPQVTKDYFIDKVTALEGTLE